MQLVNVVLVLGKRSVRTFSTTTIVTDFTSLTSDIYTASHLSTVETCMYSSKKMEITPPPPPQPQPLHPPQQRIYASVNLVSIIASSNGLSPARRQAITWTNADLLSIGPKEQTSVKFESKCKTFHLWKCVWKYRLRNGGHLVQRERWVNTRISETFLEISMTILNDVIWRVKGN